MLEAKYEIYALYTIPRHFIENAQQLLAKCEILKFLLFLLYFG